MAVPAWCDDHVRSVEADTVEPEQPAGQRAAGDATRCDRRRSRPVDRREIVAALGIDIRFDLAPPTMANAGAECRARYPPQREFRECEELAHDLPQSTVT
jgi:hypothetical protein